MPRRRAVDGYITNQDSNWPMITNNTPRDWSLIPGGGGGGTKWENCGPKTFCPPSPRDRIKLLRPPFKGWKPPPPLPSLWLKLQAPKLKIPQNFLSPFSTAKTFSAPPFCRGKTSLALPPLLFCSPPRRN